MGYELTKIQAARAREEFEQALKDAVLATGQLELFSSEAEEHIHQEVERKLYDPLLPNAGDRERNWVERLRQFAQDESLVVNVRAAASRYAGAFQELLPRQKWIRRNGQTLVLPGAYYMRREVTPKANKALFVALMELKRTAREAEEPGKLWLAQFLLDGPPEPVTNFKMECLYLLRNADGDVKRLVRLINMLGEISKGIEVGQMDALNHELFSTAVKFRAWCLKKGNFNWGVGNSAGDIELQKLQTDVNRDAAYRIAREVEYCGWHDLSHEKKEQKDAGTRHPHKRVSLRPGIWLFDECAYVDGQCLKPDDDGIIWHEEAAYALAGKGRETVFIHGRPRMQPQMSIEDAPEVEGVEGWGKMKSDAKLGAFFRETCRRFFEAIGTYEGWMAVGTMLSYAASPEIFHERKMFPSMWIHGQMGSGKSTICTYLMAVHGYELAGLSGMGLISKNVTAVGVMTQMENYSNLALWLDEFRQMEVGDDKLALIRDSYNRQLAAKWSPDGKQRLIRTAPLVSGESTTSDAAARSRYVHIQVSEHKRKAKSVESLDWFTKHAPWFFLFFRRLLERREEFVQLVFGQLEAWNNHADNREVAMRDRTTHSVAYAAFTAATVIFESHGLEEVEEFRRFMVSHTRAAAADVSSEVNINVFVQDMITAVKAGAVPMQFFRVEATRMTHPPEAPNQGQWMSYRLFMDPPSVISAMQSYLAKQHTGITLRRKDLQAQLSKNPYWIEAPPGKKLNKRFGTPGQSTSVVAAWGIDVDKHPLGYQQVSDEDFAEAMKDSRHLRMDEIGPQFEDGDPRKGPLFAIVEAVLKHQSDHELATR